MKVCSKLASVFKCNSRNTLKSRCVFGEIMGCTRYRFGARLYLRHRWDQWMNGGTPEACIGFYSDSLKSRKSRCVIGETHGLCLSSIPLRFAAAPLPCGARPLLESPMESMDEACSISGINFTVYWYAYMVLCECCE